MSVFVATKIFFCFIIVSVCVVHIRQ